jgi:hypothetical protein
MRLSPALRVFSFSFSFLVVAPRSARADDGESPPARDAPAARGGPALGSAGTIVLDEILAARSSGLSLTVGWFAYQSSTARSETAGESSTTQLRFAPSLDVFVVDGVSVGGQVAIGRAATRAGGFRTMSATREIAPRVGLAVPVADAIAFWPRLHGAYGWADTDTEPSAGAVGGVGAGGPGVGVLSGAPSAAQYWRVGGDASLVLSLGRHVALAAGPTLAYARQRAEGPMSTRSVTTSFTVTVAASLRLVL